MRLLLLCYFLLILSGCSFSKQDIVRIDGSSTVFLLTEAITDSFGKTNSQVRVAISVSGTGGGFKKFLNKEIDINEASRRIQSSEKKKAIKSGIDYLELKIAYDAIAVIANKKNTWVKSFTKEELNKVWKPNSNINKWSDINSKYPKEKISLYGPGAASGTFDYFTKVINGTSHKTRTDYHHSEDDNILVQGISGDRYSLGFFSFAYYVFNKDKLKLLGVGTPPVRPSFKSIASQKYHLLSRPLYLYVRKESLKKPFVRNFLSFYLSNVHKIAKSVGFVPMAKGFYEESLVRLNSE